MSSFLDLPIELMCVILSLWLETESAPLLYSAYCNKDLRPLWLCTVLGSPYCILSNVSSTPGAPLVSWIYQRNTRIDELYIATRDDMAACLRQSDRYGS